MQVFLRGLDHTKLFELELNCTVDEFTDKIHEASMIPKDKYMLLHNCKVVELGHKKLVDYGVTDLSTIELRFCAKNTQCNSCLWDTDGAHSRHIDKNVDCIPTSKNDDKSNLDSDDEKEHDLVI